MGKHALLWSLTLAALSVVVACSGLSTTRQVGPPPPRDIRLGLAQMAIVRVEADISRDEVTEAVSGLVAGATICMGWPTLWLEGDGRRTAFNVRFDLMARDWGEDIAADSERRMQEFVDVGYLIKRERSDLGQRAVTFVLTSEGYAALRGSPYAAQRPTFCGASGRRLVDITAMQWGEFDCGSLRVEFTHVADSWPAWARTEGARARIASTWAPIGETMPGSVTLSRQWLRADVPGRNRNGELRSLCYDSAHERIVGDDLNLNARMPADPGADELDQPLEIEANASGS